MKDHKILSLLGYNAAALETTLESDACALFTSLCRFWFSSARSKESMMRGFVNEGRAMRALAQKPFIHALFD